MTSSICNFIINFTCKTVLFFAGGSILLYASNPDRTTQIFTDLLYRGIQLYTYVEYNVENAIKYINDTYPESSVEIVENTYGVKDNKKAHIHEIASTENGTFDTDFILYEKDGYNLTMFPNNNKLHIPNLGHNSSAPKESTASFISFTVTYQNKPPEEAPLSLSFKSDKMNYFMVGNHIDKYVVWFLTKQQHGLDNYGVSYNAQIMDNNVNLPKVSSDDLIVFQDAAYTITPLNSM